MTNPLEEAKQALAAKQLEMNQTHYVSAMDLSMDRGELIGLAYEYIGLLETTVEYLRDALEVERGGMDKPPHFHIDI